uniref:Cytochrome c oxidase subunit 3 n=1 Tax=Diptera sp. 53 LC-2017 TaxID=2030330 RepID=A0A2D1CR40_9DIPT|nr:cytochrome c oxidase subunit 3 [Diptera sp. 53 LC-2017]
MNYNHNYHLVNFSPWPLMSAMSVMILLIGAIKMFNQKYLILNLLGMMITLIIMFQWWRDIIRESTFQGLHSYNVFFSMKLGMILFIVSEILFFISLFWSFFHLSLIQYIETGMIWPPTKIISFNPFLIPMLNTIILLSSGISITWSHHSLINNNFNQFMKSIMITVLLGIYFSILQMYEYKEAEFNISDSSYGSIFFLATGFHGIHVIIGTNFIMICLIRNLKIHFNKNHHFGFEAAAWYWHFVDIVWLFLYISIYWWSN